jgi:hypothetical protein
MFGTPKISILCAPIMCGVSPIAIAEGVVMRAGEHVGADWAAFD